MGKHDLIAKGLAAGAKAKDARGFFVGMSAAMFGPDDPDTKFYEWLFDNKGRLKEACAELGVDVEEGDGFARRLREAVLRAWGHTP